MPWIWSDQLAENPAVTVSQKVRNDWTQRPVAVWDTDLENLSEVAAALAAEDEEPPSIDGPFGWGLAA